MAAVSASMITFLKKLHANPWTRQWWVRLPSSFSNKCATRTPHPFPSADFARGHIAQAPLPPFPSLSLSQLKTPQRKRRVCKRPFRGSHTTCQITELVCTIWAGKKDRSQTGVGTGTSEFQSSHPGRRGLLFHPASDRRIC